MNGVALVLVAVAVGAVTGAAAVVLFQRSRVRAVERVAGMVGELTGADADSPPASIEDAMELLGEAVEDLGERERAGKAVRRRLAGALEAVPEGVLVTDEHGEVVFRNQPAEEFHEARHGEALVEAAVGELVQRALAGRPGERTLELFGPPRRTVTVEARPLTDRNGLLGAMAVIEDVTERRRLEEVRRDFVANLSHELKTPVGALSLLAETMLAEDDLQVSRRLADRILSEASRVDRTIEDLLVLSRIESEGASRREPVEISDLLNEALDRTRQAAEQRSVTVGVADGVDSAGGLAVLGNRGQLVSALSNLLDNAVKYSEDSSRVQLSVERDGFWVELVVTDEGLGIPARDIERVFERFYRVDAARSRQTGGTGLGLSIVRNVAANHDGEVNVESRLGEGSTFRLRLPLAPGKEQP